MLTLCRRECHLFLRQCLEKTLQANKFFNYLEWYIAALNKRSVCFFPCVCVFFFLKKNANSRMLSLRVLQFKYKWKLFHFTLSQSCDKSIPPFFPLHKFLCWSQWTILKKKIWCFFTSGQCAWDRMQVYMREEEKGWEGNKFEVVSPSWLAGNPEMGKKRRPFLHIV